MRNRQVEIGAVLARRKQQTTTRPWGRQSARCRSAEQQHQLSTGSPIETPLPAGAYEGKCDQGRHPAPDRRGFKPPSTTGTALILAKHRVVEDAFGETGVRLVLMTAVGRRPIAAAFRDGWAAGERVNLNRPMTGDAQGQLA
jgi:hypothetical protein